MASTAKTAGRKAVGDPGLKAGAAAAVPFESALEKLESIVESMEEGDMPLEALLERYEEGTRLVKACQAKLEEAELKIKTLETNEAGEAALRPLDMEAPENDD